MLILGLDTATPWGSMALCEDEEVVAELSLRVPRGGGEFLLGLLDMVIVKTGYRLEQLDLIAVGIGPGSYTGIRVGLAAVKGLTAGLDIPGIGDKYPAEYRC